MRITHTENKGLILERGHERWPPLLREAAGAQIAQCRIDEAANTNNNVALNKSATIGMRYEKRKKRETSGGQVWSQQPR